jgi:hypothetical protein
MADKTPDIKLKADGTVDKRFMNSFVASQRAMTSAQEKGVKSQEEYADATKNLNTKFKGLTSKLAEVNGDLAISAANIRTGSKDTFEGFLTNKKLAKGMADAANNKELKDATEALVAKQKQQTKEIEENIKVYRAKTEMESLMNEQSKTTDALKRLDLQGKIDEEQKIIDAESKKVKDAFERDLEKLQENEKRIRTAIQTDLEESTDSKGYSDFTDGLKELSGGMLDIGGFLDDATKKFNAVQKVFGGIGKAANFMTGGMLQQKDASDGLTDSIKGVVLGNQQQEESSNKLFGMVEGNVLEASLISKKQTKAMMPFLKQMGLGTLILGALGVAVLMLMDRFEGFDRWVQRFLLNNKTSPVNAESTKELGEQLKTGQITQEEYDKQFAVLESDQQTRIEDEKSNAILAVADAGANVGMGTGLLTQQLGMQDGGTDTRPLKSDGTADKRFKTTTKVAGLGGKAISVAGNVVKKSSYVVSAALTPLEIFANLDETKDMEAVLAFKLANGEITPEQSTEFTQYIIDKKREDVAVPTAGLVGGIAATVAAGFFLASNPVGWVTAGVMLASAATGAVVASGATDYLMGDSDEKLKDITGVDKGIMSYVTGKESQVLADMQIDRDSAKAERANIDAKQLSNTTLAEGFTDPTPETGLTMEDVVSMVNERNLPAGDTNAIADLIKAMGVQGASNITNLATATNTTILANNTGQSSVNDRALFNSGDSQFHR